MAKKQRHTEPVRLSTNNADIEKKQRYNELVRQKSNATKEYRQIEDRIQEYEYEIKRLKAAKRSIQEQKALFYDLKRKHKKVANKKAEWKGKKYQAFKKHLSDIESENNSYYKNSLDRILDSLNDEITRIENKRWRQMGLLGEVGALINSLGNKIENFFN